MNLRDVGSNGGICEHGNEPSCSVKTGNVLTEMAIHLEFVT